MILIIAVVAIPLLFVFLSVIAGSGIPDRNFAPKRGEPRLTPTHYLDTTIGQIRRIDNGKIEKPQTGDVYP